MTRRNIRIWYVTHKWSSIVSTLFLLMLCITGLPLIFHEEIDRFAGESLEQSMEGEASASGGVPLDAVVGEALRQRPGEVPLFVGFSQDSPLITVTTGPEPGAAGQDMTLLFFDRSTGRSAGAADETGLMPFLLELHTDLTIGRPGMFFLGAMGALFVIALVSGAVLYAPFMRKHAFGTLRTRRRRVRWLDQHNLFGIVTLAWALVVGLTGVINAFADPLVEGWREGELAEMTAPYAGAEPLRAERYASLDLAMAAAQAQLPGLSPQFVAFPGGEWSSAHHYAVFFQGAIPLTRHLLTPALIDAETGRLTDSRAMPPLNQALMLSKPLHFGDYGGLPLKLIWAALDLATIWVLVSGLYLWAARRKGASEMPMSETSTGTLKGAAT